MTVGGNACIINHLLVSYPGVNVQMWLPDYFIEVTKYTGLSMFARPHNSLEVELLAHLTLANIYFSSVERSASALTDGPSDDGLHQMTYWQVRVAQVPFAKETMNYSPGLSLAAILKTALATKQGFSMLEIYIC